MANNEIVVKVEGIEEAVSKLKKYQFIKRDAIKNIMKEIGFKVEADAKKTVPVDTGRLRASISTAISGQSGHSEKDKVRTPSGEPGFVVVIGSNVKYAPFVEFGTHKMSARPYLLPAYHKNQPELKTRIAAVFKKGI